MKVKKAPERSCVVCGNKKVKSELIRIVKTSEGNIETDIAGKKNGKGAYICRKKECIDMLLKSHRLEKNFKEKISDKVYDNLTQELIKIISEEDKT